jgi:hypothetical protein
VYVARTVFAALRLWAWCHEHGKWPGYPESVVELEYTDERDLWVWDAVNAQAARIEDFLSGRAA